MPDPQLAEGAGAAADRDQQIRAAPQETSPLVALTWNVEWLGDAEHGPEDEARQLALTVDSLTFANADMIGLQEVSSAASAQALAQAFPGYALERSRYTQPQNVALMYRADRLELRELTAIEGLDDAGRPPLEARLALPSGRELVVIVLHAKAGDDPRSYQIRKRFAAGLAAYLERKHVASDVVLLGDFNDLFSSSTLAGAASPYTVLTESQAFVAATSALEGEPERSTAWGATVDHIVLSRSLASAVVPGSVETLRDELLARHAEFFEAASDHAPVVLELGL
jgi:endonuclease/exonuclease/phosphatase family metal-dependent hydrolase